MDSLLSERREGEAESSRRIKTQFMVEFQSVGGGGSGVGGGVGGGGGGGGGGGC